MNQQKRRKMDNIQLASFKFLDFMREEDPQSVRVDMYHRICTYRLELRKLYNPTSCILG